MNPEKLSELREYYDNTSTAADLDNAVEDNDTTDTPMVGITVRLPANVLNAARDEASKRGIKVTALLRNWIESSVSQTITDDRVVPVAALRNLVADTARTKSMSSYTPGSRYQILHLTLSSVDRTPFPEQIAKKLPKSTSRSAPARKRSKSVRDRMPL